MAAGQITNPLAALGQNGFPGAITQECAAGVGGCVQGSLVFLTYSAATTVFTATKTATTTPTTSIFGVAEHAANAGQVVRVVVYGPTFVLGTGATFAAGEAFFRSAATAGIADRVVPDATTIAGTMAGTVLGLLSATAPFANAVPVFVGKF